MMPPLFLLIRSDPSFAFACYFIYLLHAARLLLCPCRDFAMPPYYAILMPRREERRYAIAMLSRLRH
jgi:hypothetical protein